MNSTIVANLLNGLSREEVRAIAQKLNVKRGKEKKDTVENLTNAIMNDGARFAVTVEVKAQYPDMANPDVNMPHVFLGKQYTYKESKVIVSAQEPKS